MNFEKLIPLFSDEWKEKYQAILAEEHLKSLDDNIQRFKDQTLDWDCPFFNEEVKIDRPESLIYLSIFSKLKILTR
ncbi:hypothetical protein ACFOEQ_22240 [Chryseobacterium arachidis]|uniref:hypothetical protein n=1 Tax=Chryseobacterium arachidis TaxID=1416778 RepID=UPI003611FC4E